MYFNEIQSFWLFKTMTSGWNIQAALFSDITILLSTVLRNKHRLYKALEWSFSFTLKLMKWQCIVQEAQLNRACTQHARTHARLTARITCCALLCSLGEVDLRVRRLGGRDAFVHCMRGACLFGRCQPLLILIFPFHVASGPSTPHSLHSFRCRDSSDFFRFFYDSALIAFNLCEFYWMSLLATVHLPLLLLLCAFSVYVCATVWDR